RAGIGAVVTTPQGFIVQVMNQSLAPITNNEAEYEGLLLALRLAKKWEVVTLEIRLDSEVVIYQMTGRFAVNSPALKRLHQQACALTRDFSRVTFTRIPRELNALADALASEASWGREWGRMRGKS
ncbi:MAG TPA: ribonuclease HI family protein, partial [Aggregatilineales bacterium]|nr:ribonuclease HI family protein [Aggregatilineales bacterium]